MYALPRYFLDDIEAIESALNAINGLVVKTEFLSPDMDKVAVLWEDGTAAGEFRRKYDNSYVFYVNDGTLQGLTDGEA